MRTHSIYVHCGRPQFATSQQAGAYTDGLSWEICRTSSFRGTKCLYALPAAFRPYLRFLELDVLCPDSTSRSSRRRGSGGEGTNRQHGGCSGDCATGQNRAAGFIWFVHFRGFMFHRFSFNIAVELISDIHYSRDLLTRLAPVICASL